MMSCPVLWSVGKPGATADVGRDATDVLTPRHTCFQVENHQSEPPPTYFNWKIINQHSNGRSIG